MGDIIGLIIKIVLIVLVVMTAATEPRLSFEYGKAMVVSGKVLYDKIKGFIQKDKPVKTNQYDNG